jgi:hypothetical protein
VEPVTVVKTRTSTEWMKAAQTLHDSPTSRAQPAAELGQHTYLSNGLLEVNPDGPHPIFELMERAEKAWAAKVNGASRTLEAAVLEYERRYSRPPPLGFDHWQAIVYFHLIGH